MIISFIRTIIIYFLIILAIRIMGKRQISELQTSELVVTFLISDLAVIPMQDSGQPLTSGLIPILTLVALELFLSIFMLKNGKFRKLICGKPILIINNGKLDQHAMKELRMSTEDLFENLRQKDVFDINEIKYAIIETNGSISLMKKEFYDTPLNGDLSIVKEENLLSMVVISDGAICENSLKICKLSIEFIYNTLTNEGLNLEEIYIMTANMDKKYNLIRKCDLNA